MIQPLAGGAAKELPVGRGVHGGFMFTRQGDRLVFVSNLLQQGTAESGFYIMSAPFDTRTGTISSAERQMTLEAVQTAGRTMPVISPDGKSVAYVSCCDGSSLRVVPIIGGNARTLASVKENAGGTVPGWLGWSNDGKFVTYHRRVGDQSTYLKVSANGGSPAVVSQWTGGAGFLMPDKGHFLSIVPPKPGQTGTGLLIRSIDGREIGNIMVPMLGDFGFSPDGKYIVGRSEDTKSTTMVAALAGGASRRIGGTDGYEWPEGWASDGRSLQFTSKENGKRFFVIKDLDGRELGRVEETAAMREEIGVQGDWFVWGEGDQHQLTNARVMARNLKTGVQRQLAGDVVSERACCTPTGPGGSYVGINGGEFYVTKVHGDRIQIHGMTVTGESRLIAEAPRSLLGQTGFSIFKNRAVYQEIVADSLRVQMTSAPGRVPITIAIFPRNVRLGDIAWSHDGRYLSLYRNDQPRKLIVQRFDDNGAVQGPPREYTLPFEYFYETFWLADGSGMTMIAQPASGGNAEVALVRFADPSNPILVSKIDPGNKWGHSLSPDGRHVAYPVERINGSVVSVVEVSELLKRAGATP